MNAPRSASSVPGVPGASIRQGACPGQPGRFSACARARPRSREGYTLIPFSQERSGLVDGEGEPLDQDAGGVKCPVVPPLPRNRRRNPPQIAGRPLKPAGGPISVPDSGLHRAAVFSRCDDPAATGVFHRLSQALRSTGGGTQESCGVSPLLNVPLGRDRSPWSTPCNSPSSGSCGGAAVPPRGLENPSHPA